MKGHSMTNLHTLAADTPKPEVPEVNVPSDTPAAPSPDKSAPTPEKPEVKTTSGK